MTTIFRGLASGIVVAVITAATAQAQSQNIVDFDNGLLPQIPSGHSVGASQLSSIALPSTRTNGVRVARGIIFDRLVRPRCVFIANQNQGGNAVQSVRVGSMTFICP